MSNGTLSCTEWNNEISFTAFSKHIRDWIGSLQNNYMEGSGNATIK